jgi:hypothetical protein
MTLALGVLTIASACATSGTSSATQNAPRRDRSVITQEEITETRATDAYGVVRAARPGWLLPKTVGSTRQNVQVYVEGNKAGTISALQQYNVNSIRELRFLEPEDATTRFGTGNGAGAILVLLKR